MREKTNNTKTKQVKNCGTSKSNAKGSVRSKKTTEGGRCCSTTKSADKKAKN